MGSSRGKGVRHKVLELLTKPGPSVVLDPRLSCSLHLEDRMFSDGHWLLVCGDVRLCVLCCGKGVGSHPFLVLGFPLPIPVDFPANELMLSLLFNFEGSLLFCVGSGVGRMM